MKRIAPKDRNLTVPDRRLKCQHGVALMEDCPKCRDGRITAERLLAELDAELAWLKAGT